MESTRILLVKIFNAIGFIIGFFLLLRIVFRFFSANPSTPLVSLVYSVSGSLIYPFKGMFRDVFIQGAAIDVSAVIALIAYSILISLIISLVNALVTPIILRHDRSLHA